MLHPNGQKREDVLIKRQKWQNRQKILAIDKLVFLDESSINLGLIRLYGWGDKHARVEEYVPDVWFARTLVISVLRLSGVCASLMFRGI
ncbi:MAG: hypothetical protein LBQ98_04300 [Nitrososphaerota archaeon]|jgi:hypothetical protein|nr:hypothetical protein [Nitrososphaerota archaeon]